jgi:hypothetical protein
MYKPNGEERMSPQEEKQRRNALAERRMERMKAATCVAEALGTTIYATLMRSSDPREELIEASFAHMR